MVVDSADEGKTWCVYIDDVCVKRYKSSKAGKNWINGLVDTDFELFNNPKNVARLFGTEEQETH